MGGALVEERDDRALDRAQLECASCVPTRDASRGRQAVERVGGLRALGARPPARPSELKTIQTFC